MAFMTSTNDIATLYAEGQRYHLSGNLAKAEQVYRQILTAEPDHVDSIHMMGVLALQAGKISLALQLIGEAARIAPENAAIASNLSSAFRRAGRLDEALKAASQALALIPDFWDAQLNLVNILADMNRHDEAADILEQLITGPSSQVDLRLRLANLRMASNQIDAAIDVLYDLLAVDPLSISAYTNLGVAFRRLGRFEDAIATYLNALALAPDDSGILNNYGIILKDLDNPEEAIACFRRALIIQPGASNTWLNLSLAELALMRNDELIRSARRAVAADPTSPPAHAALAMGLLMRGDLTEGFAEYEWRSKMEDFPSPKRKFESPKWRGENLQGRTIIVHDEQGAGDAIQFARFAPLLSQMGARVFLECNSQLVRLLSGLQCIEGVVERFAALPPHDYQCSLLSLPYLLGTTLDAIPGQTPYIFAESELALAWSNKLSSHQGLKVGLVWAGNPEFKADRLRSPGLEAFRPLLEVPGISVFALQKGAGRRDLETAQGLPQNFFDLNDQIDDFADTAAIMANLDLIVTSCTGPAHLAGALGRPTWTVLPFSPDWRWMEDREDTPWYPTMRLFRQDTRGDWTTVMQRLTAELNRQSME